MSSKPAKKVVKSELGSVYDNWCSMLKPYAIADPERSEVLSEVFSGLHHAADDFFDDLELIIVDELELIILNEMKTAP